MPIYEYECASCGARFELLVSRSKAKKSPACEECGSSDTARVMSGFFGRSGSGEDAGSIGSACGGCTASSCAGCRH